MKTMQRYIAVVLLVPFLMTTFMPAAMASQMPWMPQPGAQVALTPAFTPAYLKGMVIHPNEPFKFDFIIDRGDKQIEGDAAQAEYQKLIKYFLAALATPDTDQWVNLSPYEQDRIIPDNFGLTEMGRDLLAQDYLLKQISASLTNPDTDLGKKFWNSVYRQAYEKFGTTDVPTDIVNKIWVTPDKADIYEKGNMMLVVESHLKVMAETDYLATRRLKDEAAGTGVNAPADKTRDISLAIMRAIIIPAIEKEVNEGTSFAPVRQIYSGMLLATWYKMALKESILAKVYGDRSKVKGIDQDPAVNHEIYQNYVSAFKSGVYNMIREDVDRYAQETIPRKYFSGGLDNAFATVVKKVPVVEQAVGTGAPRLDILSVLLKPAVENAQKSSSAIFSFARHLLVLVTAGLITSGCSRSEPKIPADNVKPVEVISSPTGGVSMEMPIGKGSYEKMSPRQMKEAAGIKDAFDKAQTVAEVFDFIKQNYMASNVLEKDSLV